MIGGALVLLSAAVVPAGTEFTCTPVAVWDGDGPVWCAEGPHVRLSGIAAREMDDTCRNNQPCPQASAVAARDGLVSLLGKPSGKRPEGHILLKGPSLQCTSVGGAGGNRTAAWCVSPINGDISCAMVARGLALRWPVYWRAHRCSP